MNAKSPKITISFVKDWPAEDIIALYDAGGWWDGSDPSTVKKMIAGSYAFAVAIQGGTGKAVGMGRVLSDGVSDAYIQDVVVLPEYRKQDVGKNIIKALKEYCLKNKITWIALVAESGTADFYRRLGFRVMAGHTPMRYMIEESKK